MEATPSPQAVKPEPQQSFIYLSTFGGEGKGHQGRRVSEQSAHRLRLAPTIPHPGRSTCRRRGGAWAQRWEAHRKAQTSTSTEREATVSMEERLRNTQSQPAEEKAGSFNPTPNTSICITHYTVLYLLTSLQPSFLLGPIAALRILFIVLPHVAYTPRAQ